KKYLINTFGYREENIIFIKNGTKTDFEIIFGTDDVPEGRLYNYVKSNRSDVFVYYSGHGAPDPASRKPYFMPVNCDPYVNLRIGGYSLETFYKNLEKLPAKSITVVIDACFSGSSQQGNIIKNASPMFIDVQFPMIGAKCNVFSSATGDQIASWYPEGNHSLFTYFFLRAVRGEADQNRDRKITVKEVKDYIDENVPYTARRKYGREQTPVVKGNPDAVICTY
ncbi:MAG TPA: caspase family protein, partial [bacterium]